jgi:hypothetical protein
MAIASGVNKTVAIAKESAWGVRPAAGTAKYLRRTTMELNLSREEFQSAEISTTAQTSDSRNGTDRVEGTLNGELSPNTYDDIWAALQRGPWADGVTLTALTVVAADALNTKFVRSTGSWLTSGLNIGDVIAVSGFAAPATANNKRYTIVNLTATDIVVDSPVVAKVEGDSVVIAVSGKKLVTPLTVAARTDDSFTIEESYTDIGVHRVATGVKFGSASVGVEPDGMVTVEFGMMGKDQSPAGTAYFTTPAAATTNGTLSANAGAIFVNGVQRGVVTSFNFELNANAEAGATVFNLQPDGTRPAAGIFLGRIAVTGSFGAYYTDSSFFEAFRDETDVSVVFRVDGKGTEAMVFKFPRIKLGSPTVSDGETGGLMEEIPFTALLNDGSNAAIEQSTLVIQSIY